MNIIVYSEAGKSFGEIALISEDAVRNASIISDDETDMLVIDRELFNSTLKVRVYVVTSSLTRSSAQMSNKG